MAIEPFVPGSTARDYQRFREKGRMLPPGLLYIDSWLTRDGDKCFQPMETVDPSLFTAWIDCWKDLVGFEILELGEKPKTDAIQATDSALSSGTPAAEHPSRHP